MVSASQTVTPSGEPTKLNGDTSHASQAVGSQDETSSTSKSSEPLPLSAIVLGGGVFGAQYNSQEYLSSEIPAKVIEYAFDNGVNAIDTSPFYGASQSIIGDALASLRHKFPRSSYYISTKCGRYGANKKSFDYSPERIRRSVQESLSAFQTDYLDVVFLHDVEFIANEAGQANAAGYPSRALKDLEAYGLRPEDAGISLGEGDEAVLLAYQTLLELKQQGLIRRAGISGYPLPTLLRLARLFQARSLPLDVLQSYSHLNLQNRTLESYIPLFRAAGVGQVFASSPFNMGLLTSSGPQAWHLAPQTLRDACSASADLLKKARQTDLESVALGFGLGSMQKYQCPTLVGCSELGHIMQLVEVYRKLWEPLDDDASPDRIEKRKKAIARQEGNEELIMAILRGTKYLDWSWASPPPFEEAERS